ncbi:transglycosylase domain-containing protein [Mechercharimyces sp. CAU 1602]|uniref:transglycosylase domain-containing protein n=1 Tax=Mechercharimyces sp. CAU 1602 TaxID=2973933 RepID=UPI002161E417|nr:transglycosylase domain-containing protein [Mechercharimyces sp. CAU 1602]MCS1351829.1 transglycosylase domain-containing protein [Mechercharimyces sp. CAU 1602]
MNIGERLKTVAKWRWSRRRKKTDDDIRKRWSIKGIARISLKLIKGILLFMTVGVLLVLASFAYLYFTTDAIPFDKMNNIQFGSTIYDKNDEAIGVLGPKREYVDMEKVPSKEMLMKTFVAVEDRRFYQHGGIDYKGMARAFKVNIQEMSKAEGASTITMQVARNVVMGTRQKTYKRKVKELIVSKKIESQYSKEEILTAYLNYIPFGNQVMGVKLASKVYFGKDITKEELEPHEIALLAGLPKAPTDYNPYHDPERALERRNVVLFIMAREGLIPQTELKKYQEKDLGVDKAFFEQYFDVNYQSYTHYILLEAQERYELTAEEVTTGGYEIYTSLDPRIQESLDHALKDDDIFDHNNEIDAGATVVDPKSGEILAIGGGRYYMRPQPETKNKKETVKKKESVQLPKGTSYMPSFPLRTVETYIQPGTAIRPISVYAPLIEEENYDEYSVVRDPAAYQVEGWQPHNTDGRIYGDLPLKEAAAKSLNINSAWTIEDQLGAETSSTYAKNFGFELEAVEKSSVEALAMGHTKKGVNALDMAEAYIPFANQGVAVEAGGIRKILYNGDEQHLPKTKPRQQLDEQTAYYMTRILQYHVSVGKGKEARIKGHEVAGFTGDNGDRSVGWFIGYTNQYLMSVNVFNMLSGTKITGDNYPAKLFHTVMSDILKDKQGSVFVNPGVPEPTLVRAPQWLTLKYVASSRSVKLNWEDYSPDIMYRVERSTDGRTWKSIGVTSAGQLTDTQVGARQIAYFYRVVATGPESSTGYYSMIKAVSIPSIMVYLDDGESEQSSLEEEVNAEERAEEDSPGEEEIDPSGEGESDGEEEEPEESEPPPTEGDPEPPPDEDTMDASDDQPLRE